MDYIESIILGIVQGLTEFLPISSSGHLEIFKVVFDSDFSTKESLLFTIVLHFATALSTMVFFRKEISLIFEGLFNSKDKSSKEFSISILISMIPATLIGFFFEDTINSFFDGNLIFVGIMLYITAILLYLSDVITSKRNSVNYKNSFIIGLAQAIAIIPGISRSGATIATAVVLGIEREKAARFSFLMVVPLIFGSMLKSIIDNGGLKFENFDLITISLGFISAFITGLLACKWMIALVKKSKLYYFSIYCLVVGSIIIFYTINGI